MTVERRTPVRPVADHGHRSAVQFHELSHQRQAQTEPAMTPRAGGVVLAEALEQKGRKSALMPCPLSLTMMATNRPACSSRTSIDPPDSVNFTAFDSRFHTTCCNRS